MPNRGRVTQHTIQPKIASKHAKHTTETRSQKTASNLSTPRKTPGILFRDPTHLLSQPTPLPMLFELWLNYFVLLKGASTKRWDRPPQTVVNGQFILTVPLVVYSSLAAIWMPFKRCPVRSKTPATSNTATPRVSRPSHHSRGTQRCALRQVDEEPPSSYPVIGHLPPILNHQTSIPHSTWNPLRWRLLSMQQGLWPSRSLNTLPLPWKPCDL